MNLNQRLAEVRAEYLKRMTCGDGQLLRTVERYVTEHDGKMLRPKMVLAAAATLGQDAFSSRRTLLMATCVEMLHNASLLHDDVIDKAAQRRGRQSVNARWGNGVAVLVGDYHLAQIMQLLNDADDREASQAVNRTVIAMVESELLAQETAHPSAETYLRIIDGKTARLFATAAALGNPAFEPFGLCYGRLFQLRDDQTDGEDNEHTAPLIRQESEKMQQLQAQGLALEGFELQ